MKRAVIVVIDSLGAGAMPDAPNYNDLLECNTLGNVAKAVGGLKLPNLQKMGLGNIIEVEGVPATNSPNASFGIMNEVSEGKDTTTGHWEIAGLILEQPFKVYPNGFPQELIDKFIEKTGCKGILANCPASGTEILTRLGDEHARTGYPIVYTSADSVFQIACNVDIIPLETLYKWCEIARELLTGDYNVSRVIARPFEGKDGNYKRISKDRRDYSVAPTAPTVLNNIADNSGMVLGIGKIEDIFVKSGITHAVHTGSNKEGLDLLLKSLKKELNLSELAVNKAQNNKQPYEKELIFINLVDTDMLFGHRNDAKGYAQALEEIDSYIPEILQMIGNEDLLIITADHGCDPTTPGTDHTREYVPLLVYNPTLEGQDLGMRKTFADVAKTVANWLNVPYSGPGIKLI